MIRSAAAAPAPRMAWLRLVLTAVVDPMSALDCCTSASIRLVNETHKLLQHFYEFFSAFFFTEDITLLNLVYSTYSLEYLIMA